MTTGATRPLRRRRGGIRWWQIPLLPITFPMSLFVIFAEWARRFRVWKLFLIFMAVWIGYGQLVVMLDGDAGSQRGNVWFRDRYLASRQAPSERYYDIAGSPKGDCSAGHLTASRFSNWLLARPWSFVLACDALLARGVVMKSGFPDQAIWLSQQYGTVMFNFQFESQLTSSYLLFGLIAFALPFLLLPWLALWGCWTLLRHVHISWR